MITLLGAAVLAAGLAHLAGPVVLGMSPAQLREAAPLWRGLKAGAHGVGFRRHGASNEIAVWYPAEPGGEAMTLRDYYDPGAADSYTKFLSAAGLPSDTVLALFGAAVAARADAPASAGRYPVILVAQGNAQDAPDQAVLAEYLASHGYFVITTPSPMVKTPMTDEGQVGELAERQARELERALALVGRSSPTADRSRVGVAGHSFGARAGLLLAMRNHEVAALVSLDGGIGTATAIESFRGAPSFDRARAVAPILHFYERLDSFMTPDFSLLDGLPARVTREETAGMHHIHFTTLGFLAAMFPDIGARTGAGTAMEPSLQRIAQATLDFFDTHVARRRR